MSRARIMKGRETMNWKRLPLVVWLLCAWLPFLSSSVGAQEPSDIILYNGKIVTVDDDSFTSNLGTIAQAIHIKDGTILHVGANAEIRAMAGPGTKVIDLKGRFVMPGIINTHDHPMDWDPLNPYIIRNVVTDDVHIERFLWDEPPDEKLLKFPRVLDEAVNAAKPGQWIRISLLHGKEYRWRDEVTSFLGRQITKQQLDMAAPNNPVLVRAGFVGALVNDRALEEIRKYWGDNADAIFSTPENAGFEQTGFGAVSYRFVEPDILYHKDHPEIWAKILEHGLSWLAGYGVTTDGSMMYAPAQIYGYRKLEKEDRLAIRMPWGYFWPPFNEPFEDPYFLADIANRVGEGSDRFWFIGASPMMTFGCSTLPGITPEAQQREAECKDTLEPGSGLSKWTYNYVKAGGRIALIHTEGDQDIDYLLDIVEQASKDAGMTLEEIRAKRHAYDHGQMSPRDDQAVRLRNLGMIVGNYDIYLWEGNGARILKDYGERAASWVTPRKRLVSNQVVTTLELDRPFGYTNLTMFQVFHTAITRRDKDGNVIAPQQGVDRETMLKIATTWGSQYVLRKDKLGSLEPGKWADLAVLDKDYLTIPVDDIPKLQVLMTLVGGKVAHLVPSLAREIGMEPTGSQVELGGPAAQW